MSQEIEVQCPDCSGEGFHEVGPECGYPASNCCGGCYHQEECDTCSGDKFVTLTFEEDETADIIKALVAGQIDEARAIINDQHHEVCQ